MNNFLEFIEKDISAKKTLISTMPTKTKTNQRKLNETIDGMVEKYEDYRVNVRNYLLAKSRSFNVKDENDSKKIAELKERIVSLGHVRFLLNPSNTCFEKMGFDNLIYQISNYYIFNFKSLNDIINGFLDKFDMADIHLTGADFDYTCYVHEYMTAFLDVRYKKVSNYEHVSEIFEQVYWQNPDIVSHIELNFRKIIRKNTKKLEAYITRLQKEVMHENNISNYADCLEKLQSAYVDLNIAQREDVEDIINLSKEGKFDINYLFDGNKQLLAAYDSLVPDTVNRNDEEAMGKIINALAKFKLSVDEYKGYLEILPIINAFKEEFEKQIPKEDVKKQDYKGLKEILTKIDQKEAELEKINKKILSGKPGLFEFKSDNALKQLKLESAHRAKELYELHKSYDDEYFKDKVFGILNSTLTVSDVLNLYYSYDFFKKHVIKKVYNLNTYDEVLKYSDNFDMFAMDPTNIMIDGLMVFDTVNIPRIIANKYRLNNIKISEDQLSDDSIDSLIANIELLLRLDTIKNSKSSVEKIWFMTEVEKIVKSLEKAE